MPPKRKLIVRNPGKPIDITPKPKRLFSPEFYKLSPIPKAENELDMLNAEKTKIYNSDGTEATNIGEKCCVFYKVQVPKILPQLEEKPVETPEEKELEKINETLSDIDNQIGTNNNPQLKVSEALKNLPVLVPSVFDVVPVLSEAEVFKTTPLNIKIPISG